MQVEARILELLKDNNEMLHIICDYITKVESQKYIDTIDIKNFVSNVIADIYVEGLSKDSEIRNVVKNNIG